MKKTALFFLVTVFFLSYIQQNRAEEDNTSLFAIEHAPEFPGGMEKLMKFLNDSTRCPIDKQKNKIQGRAICQFVVNKDGSLVNIQVVRTAGDASLDKEAIRVIKSMPKWKPGENRGKVVRAKFTLPISFGLQVEQKKNDELVLVNYDDDGIMTYVEHAPEFSGGMKELMKFLNDSTKYPVEAQKNKIQGRAICQFVIDVDGSTTDIQVVRSAGDASLDKEAVRVIKSMPKWKPGKQRGKSVRVKFTLPVNFELPKTQK